MQVADRYNSGDFAGAEFSSRKAYYWSKVSIIVGITISLIVVALYAISMVLSLVIIPLASDQEDYN